MGDILTFAIAFVYTGALLITLGCAGFVAIALFRIANKLGELVGTVDALKREVEEVKQKLH